MFINKLSTLWKKKISLNYVDERDLFLFKLQLVNKTFVM